MTRLLGLPFLALLQAVPQAPVQAQRTIVVSGGGPALDLAIASSSHGDTLLVRSGLYDTGGATDQGVTVLCDPGVKFAGMISAVQIRNLPAGRTFVWRGGSIEFTYHFDAILVIDCMGSVVIDGFHDGSRDGSTVRNSAAVSFHRCSFKQLSLSGSSVSLAECSIAADLGPWYGLRVLQGTKVQIASGSFLGSPGYMGIFPPGSAIELIGGDLTIAGDRSTIIAAGQGTPPVPAIDTQGGTIWLEPSVSIRSSAPAAIAGSAIVVIERIPSVTAAGAVSGERFTACVSAPAGSLTATFVSEPVTPVSLPFGTLWVNPTAAVFDLSLVPPSEKLAPSVMLPMLPAGVPVVLQPVSLQTNGSLRLGAPASLSLN